MVQQKLTSSKPKQTPSFGDGYYEERPAKVNPHSSGLYDFMKLLEVLKDRWDVKAGVF